MATDPILVRIGYFKVRIRTHALRQLVEDWRDQIRRLWLAKTGEPLPPGWS